MLEPTNQFSEQALRHVYDDAAVGLCYLDTDLRYRHINKWLAELNGLPVEQHLGRHVRDVIPEAAAGIEAQLPPPERSKFGGNPEDFVEWQKVVHPCAPAF